MVLKYITHNDKRSFRGEGERKKNDWNKIYQILCAKEVLKYKTVILKLDFLHNRKKEKVLHNKFGRHNCTPYLPLLSWVTSYHSTKFNFILCIHFNVIVKQKEMSLAKKFLRIDLASLVQLCDVIFFLIQCNVQSKALFY